MKYSGSIYFYNEETEQEFELEIEFRYHYDPGRYYMPNGDPGYPSEETADIVQIFNEDKKPDWVTDEMIDEAFDEQLPMLLEKAQEDYYED